MTDPFEITIEKVGDQELPVFAHRPRSLREVLALAETRGDAPFLVYGDRQISFGEFVALANSASAGLTAAGVVHGDRVAILAENCPEWCITLWGAIDIGAIAVGLNGWWKSEEILHGLEDSGARVLVTDRARFAHIASVLDRCEDLETVYLLDLDPDDLERVPSRIRALAFDDLVSDPSAGLPTVAIAEDDPATIFYTSGTTGRPKGGITTHRNMIAGLQITAYVASASGDSGQMRAEPSVALLTNPLFHLSGCHATLVPALAAGTKLVMLPGRFDPATALQLIEDHRVTAWGAVPTMLWRVSDYPDRSSYDTTSVTRIGTGGAPSAGELQRRIRENFPNVRASSNIYGMTEVGGVAANSGVGITAKPGSVGRALPTVEVRITGDDGTDLASYQTGEVRVRSAMVMPGYWNNPQATAEIIQDGWARTGDVGYLDEDGFLFLTDRAKDMIIRGGENVYCIEIEERLVEHTEIADAAVIGVPHSSLGEEVKAIVQTAPGASLSAQEVQAWVADALANFKVPAHVELRADPLPRNPAGKLLKNVLRGTGDVPLAEIL